MSSCLVNDKNRLVCGEKYLEFLQTICSSIRYCNWDHFHRLFTQFVEMSFDVDTFVTDPKLTGLTTTKRSELVALANHYELEVHSGMRKADARKLVSEYLLDENVISDKEVNKDGESAIELKKMELREREREPEVQVQLKELEIRECEIAIQMKVKELGLAATTVRSSSASEQFDVTRHIRFVPPFQETEPDKYFLHFEKIATSLSWPKEYGLYCYRVH